MKWTEIDGKERVRLILQHVMGYFVLEEAATGWRTPELKETKPPDGFHWPIAFWNTDSECWMIRDIATDPQDFDPMQSMDAAWKLVEHFRGRYDVHIGSAPFQYDVAIMDRRMGGKQYIASSQSTSEAICLAALKASGVDIDDTHAV